MLRTNFLFTTLPLLSGEKTLDLLALKQLSFRKAQQACANGHSCVEVAWSDGFYAVRDSKQQGNGPVLVFTEGEWDAFKSGIISGEFERKSLATQLVEES